MAVSYEELMEKKLDRIDDRRDKRQGSLIYDALAPNAAETAQFYADLICWRTEPLRIRLWARI